MFENILLEDYISYFNGVVTVFIIQIFTLSAYLPYKWLAYRKALFELHPQEKYPQLYIQPESIEKNRQDIRQILDALIIFIGLTVIFCGKYYSLSVDELAFSMLIFSMVQMLPYILSRYWGTLNSQLMKEQKNEKVMKASMTVRKLTDFISPQFFAVAVLMYLSSIVIGILIPMDSRLLIIMISLNTLINIHLIRTVINGLYSERIDQYLNNEDRLKQIAKKLRKLILSSIVFSAFILAVILIEFYGKDDALLYIITSFFVQIIFVIEVSPKIERDFSVYKNLDPTGK